MHIQSQDKKLRKTNQAEYKFHNCDVQKIITGLYIGDAFASNNLELLHNLGIKHIVVVGLELKTHYPQHFNYLHVPVKDHRKETICNFFQITNVFIQKALAQKQIVFVHCAKGVSRSATIILAFLMYKYKMQSQQAITYVKRKRKQISPNQGFVFQLKKYQEKLGISQNDSQH